jgi:[DsrC]-trisulfide reductase subunit J
MALSALIGRFVGAIGVLALLVPALAFGAGDVPKPVIEIARPGKCVEPTALIRRNHADMLLRQRELTVRGGMLPKKFNLIGCVQCHASKKTGSVLGPKGFCQSCHAYAGVQIDCFDCHEPKRDPKLDLDTVSGGTQ